MRTIREIIKTSIFKGISASYANTAISAISNFIIIPLYIKYLGRQEYGLWIAVSGITTYLGFLNLGIGQTTANLFGKAVADNDVEYASVILSTGFWRFVKITAAGILILSIVAPVVPFNFLFKNVSEVRESAKAVIMVAAFVFMVELPFGIFGGCLRNIGKIQTQQIITSGQTAARVLTAFIYLSCNGGLLGLIIALGAVDITFYCLQYRSLARNVKGIKVSTDYYRNDVMREMKSPSFFFLLLQVSGAIAFSTDTLVISSMIGIGAVTSYSIAQRVATTASGMVTTVSSNFAPSFLESYTKYEFARLKKLFYRAMIISVGAGISIGILLIAGGPLFIKIWVGPQNYVGFFPFVMIVALVFTLMVLNPADALLTVTNNHKVYALFAFWEAMLNLALSIYLAPKLGVAGVAMGTVIARILGAGPVMLLKSYRLIEQTG